MFPSSGTFPEARGHLSFLLWPKVPCARADVPCASPALQDSRVSPMTPSHWALTGCMCGLSVHQVPLPLLCSYQISLYCYKMSLVFIFHVYVCAHVCGHICVCMHVEVRE